MKVKIKIEKVQNGYIVSNDEVKFKKIATDSKGASTIVVESLSNYFDKMVVNTTRIIDFEIK